MFLWVKFDNFPLPQFPLAKHENQYYTFSESITAKSNPNEVFCKQIFEYHFIFLREYQACQANLVVKEISETKALLENLVEMAKMDFVDLKVTQVNQVHKVCQEDKVEMEWLDLLVQLVLWSKVKKFQVLLDNQALMGHLDPQERQA